MIASAVERHDLRTPKVASEAEQQHGPVPQPAQQTAIERLKHVDQVFGQDRFLLLGRGGVGVADAGHHRGDVPKLAIQAQASLCIVPGQR